MSDRPTLLGTLLAPEWQAGYLAPDDVTRIPAQPLRLVPILTRATAQDGGIRDRLGAVMAQLGTDYLAPLTLEEQAALLLAYYQERGRQQHLRLA